MRKIIGEYTLGDMIARYETDESKKVGLFLCPLALAEKEYAKKVSQVDSLIQIKIAGDMYNGAYAQGQTLREGESVRTLSFKWQQTYEEEDVFCIKTVLEDVRGYEACHILRWKKGTAYVRMKTEFSNYSKETVSLELLTSFSLQNISPWLEGDCANDIYVHRMQGRWSEEGRHQVQTMEELQLETSWTREAVRCERFGSIGSMPVNRYFPFLTLEDRKNNVFWGVQLETPSSWQMEIYRVDDNIAIDGGIADREFGHWVKDIQPDASFMTPEAIVSVCHTDQIDILTKRLTDAGKEALPTFPASEKTLPILFNEYCTTWGNPSHENIQQILQAIRGKGFEYFVIDCGWYKENGVPWDISMGDYTVSEELFPEGLQKTVDAIHEEGMKAGIWFEIETVGPAAHAYDQDAHFLKRDNAIITTHR